MTVRRLCLLFLTLALAARVGLAEPALEDLAAARKAHQQGNHKDAFEAARAIALTPGTDTKTVADALDLGLDCLLNLNRQTDTDPFVKRVIESRPERLVLSRAATRVLSLPSYASIVSGAFKRGWSRGRSRSIQCAEQDRRWALRLLEQALEKATSDLERAALNRQRAQTLLAHRDRLRTWRLFELSDLERAPNRLVDDQTRANSGAAVDDEGTPRFHLVPQSFESAANDGERWRWSLAEASRLDPANALQDRVAVADFSRGQFGVNTTLPSWGGQAPTADDPKGARVRALTDNQSYARLADGARSFSLPADYDFIAAYRSAEKLSKPKEAKERFASQLAAIFEVRQQRAKAAAAWKRAGDEKRRAQLLGHWGRLLPPVSQPKGAAARLEYRFRNAGAVSFQAYALDQQKLLEDITSYLSSKPARLDHGKLQVESIGQRVVQGAEDRYRGARVAEWRRTLKPAPDHQDRQVNIEAPLRGAGCYLIVAEAEDGNTSRAVLWIHDTVIVEKAGAGRTHYYLGDARSGAPVAGAKVEFLGYRTRWVRSDQKGRSRPQTEVIRFAETSGSDGLVAPAPSDQESGYQWLIVARSPEGRLASLGFNHIWQRPRPSGYSARPRAVALTDRPIYRPGDPVSFKVWVRDASYELSTERSSHAGRSFTVRITDPRRQKVLEKSVVADAWGGLEGRLELPSGATLGRYQLRVLVGNRSLGGCALRVEEYKKPEFEVEVEAPSEPVALGERIAITVKGRYYSGSPVTEGRLRVTVRRLVHDGRWYPEDPWDWLYGSGYWWFGGKPSWYPGWRSWGCIGPGPGWRWSRTPPELVLEQEAALGPDGTLTLSVDTAKTLAEHGDLDHRYEVTAELTDSSRRTITGRGAVLVARQPFKVFAWTDRGHYRLGDSVRASFRARRLDGESVAVKGRLSLYRSKVDEQGAIDEQLVQSWEKESDADGTTDIALKVTEEGRYRVAYSATDAKGRAVEGGCLFLVAGPNFDGARQRFEAIELLADERRYKPGDVARIRINADRAGATVVLGLRAQNGLTPTLKVLELKGKSQTVELPITRADMPNIFIEAFTISDGRVHTAQRQLVVPPERRVLKMSVEPAERELQPGSKTRVRLRVTDQQDRPVVGSVALTVYDRALDAIAGGGLDTELRALFWGWRRSHRASGRDSLRRGAAGILKPNEESMAPIGARRYSATLGFGANDRRFAGRKGSRGAPGAPAPAAAEKSGLSADAAADGMTADQAEAAGPEASPAPLTIRTSFADSAYWNGAITTDADGRAEVEVSLPDDLSSWRIQGWAMAHGTRVGQAKSEMKTRKRVMLRLQAPRFFVERDEVVLSANVHNELEEETSFEVALALEGGCLTTEQPLQQSVVIAAGGERRVDWRVQVARPGEAVIRMSAVSSIESDGVERRFPVKLHGMTRVVTKSGVVRLEQERGEVAFSVPEKRRSADSRLVLRVSPSLAGAMVDALPYLAEYPYGCTEQTLNRFLPTVITRKVLTDMGLDLPALKTKRSNLNAQQLGDPAERAADWQRWARNPVFDEATVTDMVKKGVKRLTSMQCADGGWGWFSGPGERSAPHTTATVIGGLLTAKDNGVALVSDLLPRGVAWLRAYQARQVRRLENAATKTAPYKTRADNLDALIYHVLARADALNAKMQGFLYRDRGDLSVTSKALFALALHDQKQADKVAMLRRNIEQYLVRDAENQSCWLELGAQNPWWCWYGDEVEAMACTLELLARLEPTSPDAAGLAKYLVNNRGAQSGWRSTRATGLVIGALATYLKASGEAAPDMELDILLDDRLMKTVKITKDNFLSFDDRLVLEGDAVTSGAHRIELRRRGKGAVYYSLNLSVFDMRDDIPAAGLEVKVSRRYYRLERVASKASVAGSKGQALRQDTLRYERVALRDGEALKSGQLLEVELTIDSKNDYEYLMFEDMKAAGCEPVETRSGYLRGAPRAYRELRDDRVTFFMARLPRGRHNLSYRLRAEVPGRFSALPTRAEAMYAPELRANSAETKVSIRD